MAKEGHITWLKEKMKSCHFDNMSELRCIMLSEINQTEKDKHFMILYVCILLLSCVRLFVTPWT